MSKVIKIVKSWVRTVTQKMYAFFQTSPKLRRFCEHVPLPIKLIIWHVYALVLIWFIIDGRRIYRNLSLILDGESFIKVILKWIGVYYHTYQGMIEIYVLHVCKYNKAISIFLKRLEISGVEHIHNAIHEKGYAVLSPIQFTNLIFIPAVLSNLGISNQMLIPLQTWEIVARERAYNRNYLGDKTQMIKITDTGYTFLKLLRNSHDTVILMPVDANEGIKTRGITLNMFGRHFNGGIGAVVMGIKFDVPVLLCKLVRVGYFRYRLIIFPPFRFDFDKENTNNREALFHACQLFYHNVEIEVLKHLEQWMPLYTVDIYHQERDG